MTLDDARWNSERLICLACSVDGVRHVRHGQLNPYEQLRREVGSASPHLAQRDALDARLLDALRGTAWAGSHCIQVIIILDALRGTAWAGSHCIQVIIILDALRGTAWAGSYFIHHHP